MIVFAIAYDLDADRRRENVSVHVLFIIISIVLFVLHTSSSFYAHASSSCSTFPVSFSSFLAVVAVDVYFLSFFLRIVYK